MKQRGYSLPEVLVALVILTVIITTTLAMFAKRRAYIRESSETMLAWQAIWNESEIWRRIDWNVLEGQPKDFQSNLNLLAPMAPYETKADVALSKDDPHIKNVTLTVNWDYDEDKKIYRREAHVSILRADTGGTNLW